LIKKGTKLPNDDKMENFIDAFFGDKLKEMNNNESYKNFVKLTDTKKEFEAPEKRRFEALGKRRFEAFGK
jgi:hypothetical protein